MPLVRKPGSASQQVLPASGSTRQGLASGDEEIRWAAAREASATAPNAPLLAAALRAEPAARVREALFTSLARMGEAGVAEVVPLLREDDANLRTGAVDALRLMVRGSPQLLPPLLQDADPDVRILSCELARELPGEDATRLLGDLLQGEPEHNVCAAAVDVLAEVGQPQVLPVLAACKARFADSAFLAFAIQIAIDRISAAPPRNRD